MGAAARHGWGLDLCYRRRMWVVSMATTSSIYMARLKGLGWGNGA